MYCSWPHWHFSGRRRMQMRAVKILKKWWRRTTAAGVDNILDFEVSSIQGILGKLDADNYERLLRQIERYDRVDRSPNRRKQRFVDDDSSFNRPDWPRQILFKAGNTEHVATVRLRHRDTESVTVTAKAFIIFGRFDGFEFDFHKTRGVSFESFPISDIKNNIENINTKWEIISVEVQGSWQPQ